MRSHPPPKQLPELTTEELAAEIEALGSAFAAYSKEIRENGVDGADWVEYRNGGKLHELLDELNITSALHRRKLHKFGHLSSAPNGGGSLLSVESPSLRPCSSCCCRATKATILGFACVLGIAFIRADNALDEPSAATAPSPAAPAAPTESQPASVPSADAKSPLATHATSQAARTDFPSYTLVDALDAALTHGVAHGVNLSESRALLLNAFSPSRLRSLEAAHARQYRLADPFPHTVFDGLLPEAVLSAVAREQPEAYNSRGCVKGTKFCVSQKTSGGTLVQAERVRVGKYVAIARRSERNRESAMGPHTLMVFRALKSNEFRAFLERLSGISPLISDPKYAGAGVHFAAPGAKLNLHADFNMGYGLQRRVNIFLYLNRGWREEYGGHLQLWDRNLSRCVQRILPTWNRFVAFSTGDFTYHGHPTPLSCPDHRMRRALVLYFYARNRPPNECSCRRRADMVCPQDCGVPHNTLWVTPRHCAACEDPSCARYPSEHVARDGLHLIGK